MENDLLSKPGAAKGARPRRARRSTAEIRQLILDAARDVFALRGFAGATTRQIAALAEVAEPLIFNNFGSKEVLFAEAVIQPFNTRFAQFLTLSANLPNDRELRSGEFVHALYPFLRSNADLLMALVKSAGEVDPGIAHGLEDYFSQAVTKMRAQYQAASLRFDVTPELLVRYTFGMMAGSVLFADWLFPDGAPSDEQAVAALGRMIFKAAEPAAP